jgi:predicted nucleic acid-binding protein
MDPNDALAVGAMSQHGISEIYSFDRDFDGVEGITRMTG